MNLTLLTLSALIILFYINLVVCGNDSGDEKDEDRPKRNVQVYGCYVGDGDELPSFKTWPKEHYFPVITPEKKEKNRIEYYKWVDSLWEEKRRKAEAERKKNEPCSIQ